jgi:hypothetical protein
MISGPGSTSKINVDPTSSTLNAVGSGGRDARKRELMKAHRAVPNGAQETWRVSALKAIRSEVTYCRCGAVDISVENTQDLEYRQRSVKPWLNYRSVHIK